MIKKINQHRVALLNPDLTNLKQKKKRVAVMLPRPKKTKIQLKIAKNYMAEKQVLSWLN
jgi:hypothetical protein